MFLPLWDSLSLCIFILNINAITSDDLHAYMDHVILINSLYNIKHSSCKKIFILLYPPSLNSPTTIGVFKFFTLCACTNSKKSRFPLLSTSNPWNRDSASRPACKKRDNIKEGNIPWFSFKLHQLQGRGDGPPNQRKLESYSFEVVYQWRGWRSYDFCLPSIQRKLRIFFCKN